MRRNDEKLNIRKKRLFNEPSWYIKRLNEHFYCYSHGLARITFENYCDVVC